MPKTDYQRMENPECSVTTYPATNVADASEKAIRMAFLPIFSAFLMEIPFQPQTREVRY